MVKENNFILVVGDNIFVISELDDGDFVPLALLLIIFDLPVSIFQHFSIFSYLVLQSRSLILESDCNLPYFPINHTLSLTLHQVPQIFKFFSFAPLGSLVSCFPLVDLLHQIRVFLLL